MKYNTQFAVAFSVDHDGEDATLDEKTQALARRLKELCFLPDEEAEEAFQTLEKVEAE